MSARRKLIASSLVVSTMLICTALASTGAALGPVFLTIERHGDGPIEKAILAADDRFWQAASDHDVAVLETLLADQYTGLTPDGVRWDKASCLAQHKSVRVGDVVRSADRTVVQLHPDAAVLTYRAAFTMFDRAGTVLDRAHQRLCSYWVRQDGQWKVLFAHVTPLDVNPLANQQPTR